MTDKSELSEILKELSLSEYEPCFREHAIDDNQLPTLSQNDLLEIGIKPLGHRKRLLDEIRRRFRTVDRPQRSLQKRHISVLFADLVGSTRLAQSTTPENLRRIIKAFHELASESVDRYDGYVAQYLGDGVLAYFGFPVSHQYDTDRAIRAGLELIRSFDRIRQRFEGENPGLDLRVGIEAGPVIISDEPITDEAAIGETPNLAAKIQSVAEPGQLLIGPTAKSSVSTFIESESCGAFDLLGDGQSLPLYLVAGAAIDVEDPSGRSESNASCFVGREAELSQMKQCIRRFRGGEAVACGISGDAGIGKSRLVREFLEQLPDEIRVLKASCPQFDAPVLFPFGQLLKQFISWNLHPNPETAFLQATSQSTDNIAYLLRLSGLQVDALEIDQDNLSARTQSALIDWLVSLGKLYPLVLFVNDIHWIDERGEAILDDLIRRRPRGLMVICTYRKGYEPPWKSLDGVDFIQLAPLTESETRKLFRFSVDDLDDQVEILIERSGGNPLFIEELAANFRLNDERYGDQNAKDIPANLAGLLMQRFDRLSNKARRLLRLAAVSGRSFSVEMLSTEDVNSNLVEAELLKSSIVLPGNEPGTLIFKHGLIRDAIYNSVLGEDLRAMHANLAARIEDNMGENPDDFAEQLARHYEMAAISDKAAYFAFKAGKRALEMFALRDASRWFEKSLSLSQSPKSVEDQELRASAVNNQLQVLCWEARFGEMLALGREELSRFKEVASKKEIAHMLAWLGEASLHNWQYQDSIKLLNEALELASSIEDEAAIGHTLAEWVWHASITIHPKDRNLFDRNLQRLFSIGRNTGDRLLMTHGHYAKWALAVHDGRMKEMSQIAGQLLDYAERSHYPPAKCWGNCMMAYTEILNRNLADSLEHCEAAKAASECAFDRLASDLCLATCYQIGGHDTEANSIFSGIGRPFRDVGSFFFGYASNISNAKARFMTGDQDEALGLLSELCEYYELAGNPRAAAMAMSELGALWLDHAGTENKASELLQRAEALASDYGMHEVLARTIMARARIAAMAGDQNAAESMASKACSIVKELGWLTLEQSINAAALDLRVSAL